MGPIISLICGIVIGLYFLREWLQGKNYSSRDRLDGKTVVITGGNVGIGKETARELSRRGARVILCCRNMDKGKAAAKEISDDTGREVVVYHLDLAVFDSVLKLAQTLLREESKLHILINNAGVVMYNRQLSVDGNEITFQTNHLGHFLLTNLLLPMIKSSQPARIINVSSDIHKMVKQLNFDDLTGDSSYSMVNAYSQSKLANVLFSTSLHRRLQGNGITVYSLHPGVVKTEIGRAIQANISPILYPILSFVGKLFFKTSVKGAQTSIFCAVDPALANESGKYYCNCSESQASSYASNEENAEKLWKISEKIVSKFLTLNTFNKEKEISQSLREQQRDDLTLDEVPQPSITTTKNINLSDDNEQFQTLFQESNEAVSNGDKNQLDQQDEQSTHTPKPLIADDGGERFDVESTFINESN